MTQEEQDKLDIEFMRSAPNDIENNILAYREANERVVAHILCIGAALALYWPVSIYAEQYSLYMLIAACCILTLATTGLILDLRVENGAHKCLTETLALMQESKLRLLRPPTLGDASTPDKDAAA